VIIFLVFGSVFFNFFNLLRNKNNLAAERFRSAEHSLGNPDINRIFTKTDDRVKANNRRIISKGMYEIFDRALILMKNITDILNIKAWKHQVIRMYHTFNLSFALNHCVQTFYILKIFTVDYHD